MKRLNLLGLFLVICLYGFGQRLHAKEIQPQSISQEAYKLLCLDDFLMLLQFHDIAYMDEYLSEKEYVFLEARDELIDSTLLLTGKKWEYAWNVSGTGMQKKAYAWLDIWISKAWDYNLTEIFYQFFEKTQWDVLETDLKKQGFERLSSEETIDGSLICRWRNAEYEVRLMKGFNDDGENARPLYVLYIFDFLKKEAFDKKCEQVEELLSMIPPFIEKAEYEKAKTYAVEALALTPNELMEVSLSLLIEVLDVRILAQKARRLNVQGLYEEAEQTYRAAIEADNQLAEKHGEEFIESILDLDILDQALFTALLQTELKEIQEHRTFLENRQSNWYSYRELEEGDYISKKQYIEKRLEDYLENCEEDVTETEVDIDIFVDTLGISDFRYTIVPYNEPLYNFVRDICQGVSLKQVSVRSGIIMQREEGDISQSKYTVNAIANYVFTIEHTHQIGVLKKTTKGDDVRLKKGQENSSVVSSQMKTAPYGKYTFDLKSTSINGKYYNKNRLQKMRCVGGPENALLSLIIPGLGMHKVTYGKNIGLETMLPTYALLGGGIGFKVYSNKEYKKYHDATTQTEMDKHYKSANLANYAFYGCMLAGGLIWISDIIRVAVIGSQNLKKFNAYKHSYLGYYYNPEIEALGLSYTIKF